MYLGLIVAAAVGVLLVIIGHSLERVPLETDRWPSSDDEVGRS